MPSSLCSHQERLATGMQGIPYAPLIRASANTHTHAHRRNALQGINSYGHAVFTECALTKTALQRSQRQQPRSEGILCPQWLLPSRLNRLTPRDASERLRG